MRRAFSTFRDDRAPFAGFVLIHSSPLSYPCAGNSRPNVRPLLFLSNSLDATYSQPHCSLFYLIVRRRSVRSCDIWLCFWNPDSRRTIGMLCRSTTLFQFPLQSLIDLALHKILLHLSLLPSVYLLIFFCRHSSRLKGVIDI